MPKTSSRTRSDQIASFRLRRHHLLDEPPAAAITICRDICGAQAQVMSAAYLQFWTRNHCITRAEIERALWQDRTLIKTSLMRQTLHLIPSDEFWLYIAAQRPSRVAGALRVMARCGISREEGEALTPLIMDALSSGPLGRTAIADAVRPKVSKRVRAWMALVWSMIRLPVAEGLVCHGRGEGNEVVFIRVDQWLPKLKPQAIAVTAAQCELLRKYLRAFGPATLSDFSHWSGISMQEVRPLRSLLEADLTDLPGETQGCLLLREDAAALNDKYGEQNSVRLLPSFDTYLLAHRDKDHLLSARYYKRVYRNQGWISPVVLIDGAIAGIWSYKLQGKNLLVEIAPFVGISRTARSRIEKEGRGLASFFESELVLKFA